MAITTNTTKTVNRTSIAIGDKCEATKKNMTALCKRAGIKTPKMVTTMIPMIPGSKDDVVFVGLNGVSFYFMRGQSAEIPEEIVEILRNCQVL